MNRLIRVRTGKHPHEISLIAATAVIGAVGVVVPERISGAVNSVFPWPWAVVYWGMMVVFALITLWGIFRKQIDGLLVERAGLTVMAALYGAYCFAVVQYSGLSGLVATALPAALSTASLVRCWQIKTDLALLKQYLKDHPGESIR